MNQVALKADVPAALKRPKHILGIPNGNRRKAEELKIDLSESYMLGAVKALEFVDWSREVGATDVTLFGLSCENKEKRTQSELDALIEGATWFCDHIGDVDCRVHIFGKYEELKGQKNYAELHARLVALNGANTSSDFTVHVAVNYSGMLEHETDPLLDAVALHGIDEVRRNRSKYILSAGVPRGDLLIRTGGEHRTSGLLPFQAGYAELRILDVLWADLSKEMFDDAVRWYGMQPRNFGK